MFMLFICSIYAKTKYKEEKHIPAVILSSKAASCTGHPNLLQQDHSVSISLSIHPATATPGATKLGSVMQL